MLYPRRPIIRCVIVAFVGGHAASGSRHRAGPPSHSLEYTSVAGLESRSQESPRSLQAISHAECLELTATDCDSASVLAAHMAKISAMSICWSWLLALIPVVSMVHFAYPSLNPPLRSSSLEPSIPMYSGWSKGDKASYYICVSYAQVRKAARSEFSFDNPAGCVRASRAIAP